MGGLNTKIRRSQLGSTVTSPRILALVMALVAYPLIPIINLLASVLNILTFTTAFRQTWNIGLPMISAWLFIATFIRGVEGIVWHDASGIKAPVWCDIGTLVIIDIYESSRQSNFNSEPSWPCKQSWDSSMLTGDNAPCVRHTATQVDRISEQE